MAADEFGRVKVKLPWWHIFSKKLVNSGDLEADIEKELLASLQTGPQSDVQKAAYVLDSLSKVLKVHHDTAMGIIRNIR